MLETPVRLGVRLGVVALLALAGLLLTPASAYACSCVAAGPAQYAQWADVVLDGVVVGRDVSHPFWPTMSSGDPVTYRGEVIRVFKGRVGPETQVRSAVSSATCGISVAVGRRYVLYADRSGGGALQADSCGGTRVSGHDVVTAAVRTVGRPHPPDATIRPPGRHLATTAWGAGGAALALVALVASGLAVRAGRAGWARGGVSGAHLRRRSSGELRWANRAPSARSAPLDATAGPHRASRRPPPSAAG